LKRNKVDRIRRALSKRVRRILLIDDDVFFLRQLTEVLAEDGFEVVGVRSARDALSRTDLGRFDLILCDVVMPEIYGLQFLELLHETPVGHTVKAVLMTSTDPSNIRQRAEDLGCDGFLTKPIDERIVRETVKSLLD
jgi:CheY-like chemotaxis protein